jgi:hypothetical protein
MKRKFCFLAGIFVLVLASSTLYAQKLVVRMNDGLENSEALSSVQKLYFSGNQLVVDYYSGSDDDYLLSDVRKIYFDLNVSVEESQLPMQGKLLISPNPANNSIMILGIPVVPGRLSVYSMDGSMVISREISSDHETLDISNLPQGLYLVSVPGLTSKFVKR